MKKFYFLIAILGFSIVSLSQEPQAPNSNFENWDSLDSLIDWNSAVFIDLGPPVGVIRIPMAEQESADVFEGDYAVKMETKDYMGYTVPGMMQLGQLNSQEFIIEGGYPFEARPMGMSVFAKYNPAENDTAMVFAYMTKYNQANNSTDTIGATVYPIWDTIADYTELLMPFVYESADTCDTINIVFMSTNPLNMKIGSVLWVDSLRLKYSIDAYPTLALPASDVTDTSFIANWTPSPYSFEYYLDVASDSNFIDILPGYDNIVVDTFNFYVHIPETQQGQEEYFYRVRVKYADTATSINSNVIKVLPSYPTECLPATNITGNSFQANWRQIQRAENYLLDIATDENFNNYISGYQAFNTGQDTTHLVTNLDPDTEYFYRVKTIYPAGESPYSNVVNVLTLVNLHKILDYKYYFVKNKSLYLFNLAKNSNVLIYDVNGRLIYSENANTDNLEVPFSHTGVYLVIIKKDNNIWRLKISL